MAQNALCSHAKFPTPPLPLLFVTRVTCTVDLILRLEMDLDDANVPRVGPVHSVNFASFVRSRFSSGVAPSGPSLPHEYEWSRYRVRARFEVAPEGCTFALKFAPNCGASQDEQFCLLTHSNLLQVWEMSGVYSQRRKGALHGAQLVMTLRQHTDVVAECEWMPASFCETFEHFEPGTSPNDEAKSMQLTMPPFFTAGFDKVVKFYRGGICAGTLTEHADWIRFLSVNATGSTLASGSVSSSIFGWDTSSLKPIWRIVPAHEAPPHLQTPLAGINSINGLEWSHSSHTTFASGAGDGSIKFWDTRLIDSNANQNSCVGSLVAHSGKLNNVKWLKDDRFLLSSGRDDVIRLLDVRMLRNAFETKTDAPLTRVNEELQLSKMVVQEYRGHSCSGYNVQAALCDGDATIVTGSRDGKVYFYDTWSGKNVLTLSGPEQPVHLAVPLPPKCGRGIIAATAVSGHMFVWAPSSTAEHTTEEDLLPKPQHDEASIMETARQEALERTVSQFGERFLKALRMETPANRAFFDNDVREAYQRHMLEALRRRGVPLQDRAGQLLRRADGQRNRLRRPHNEDEDANVTGNNNNMDES